MSDCIIFDLDGTLADLSHRVHFVDGSPFVGARVTFREPSDPVEAGCRGWITRFIDTETIEVDATTENDESLLIACQVAFLKIHSDWKQFFEGMDHDLPVEPIMNLLNILKKEHSIVLCSGRPETHRARTESWLKRHSISYDALYLRDAGDNRTDDIVKREILHRIREDGYDPWLAVDDRDSVVRMWREEGLTCLQCADGDF